MTDLISRSAVLAIGNVRRVTEYDEAGYDMTYDAVPVEAIEALPAIDVVPVVHARWAGVMWCYRCTNCGAYGPDDGGHKTKFCPDCGARMDAESKEDTDGSQTD